MHRDCDVSVAGYLTVSFSLYFDQLWISEIVDRLMVMLFYDFFNRLSSFSIISSDQPVFSSIFLSLNSIQISNPELPSSFHSYA